MTLLASLGKQTIRIGSAPECEIVLGAPGIPSVAAIVVHQGHGRLSFVPEQGAICAQDGQPLAAGAATPLDFRSTFTVAGSVVPLLHPALCLMVMARGYLRVPAAALTIGRDPGKCHVVMNSPGVSGRHATLSFSERQWQVVDHGSTSGTWLDGARLEPEKTVILSKEAVLSIGPLPLPVSLAEGLHAELAHTDTDVQPVSTEGFPMMPGPPSLAVVPPSVGKHRTVVGTIRMAASTQHSIGRTKDNDIVLDYPQISGLHARLVKLGAQIFLEDAGSELGTFVRGSQLRSGQRARVEDGEIVRLGPVRAVLRVSGDSVNVEIEDQEGWIGRPLFEIEARGVSVVVPDRENKKQSKVLLEDISFKALPGDLIALMGPSGSGKTTLLHALTGYVRPTTGEVLINGQPLSQIFDALRGSIGYVPQDDIIHPELTVREAVRYSARFRLPPDFSPAEIDERVELTLQKLGLEGVAHLQIGKPEQKVLSGGQRKRVNIAMELVTDPVLLFLDEPTSGLAANDTTLLVEQLATLSRDSGKTIIATIHQPAKDEYERFNLALILGHGGIELYFGPTTDAYGFFQAWRAPSERTLVSSPRDMFAELPEREARFKQALPGATRAEIRVAVSNAYRSEYGVSPVHAAMSSGARASETETSVHPTFVRRERPQGQLRLLLSRYFRIKTRDKVGTAILLLQAPLIGILLALVFGLQKRAIPYWCLGALEQLARQNSRIQDASERVISSLQETSDHTGALFFLVVAAVWFGTSNAAREVVSERAIFHRERMVNLAAVNYVLSKFLVLAALCIVQCTLLLGIVFFSLGLGGGIATFLTSLGIMVLTAFCSVALGLLLSSVVASTEAAMALTPIALIPQVVLGGLMVPVTTNAWLEAPMQLIPARWGFEGVVRGERAAVAAHPAWNVPLPGAPESRPDFVWDEAFHCSTAQLESSVLNGAWGFGSAEHAELLPPFVLVAMTLALLLAVVGLSSRRH